MVEYNSLFAFFVLAVVATLSPGPAVLLAISNGANLGVRKAVIGIFGNVSAMIFYATFASLGMGVLINEGGEFLLRCIQFAGGLYLCYLGYKSIVSVRTNKPLSEPHQSQGISVFTKAALVGLSNPKAIIFFSALFPQFINNQGDFLVQTTILTSIFAGCSFSALTMYAFLSSKIFVGRNNKWFNFINKLSGVIFMCFGIALMGNSIKN
ncbi:LysE family translocator [Vibrio spartinae]|uniref:Homoserine/homoserine lactone efflux protein n=1 Tax=Vibrio spartinae TaxID=1918945 RepID=A0A1N6M386_9VIBR|nr:LysE family translocator [Vibrio spartinae]QMV14336.1 Homoserine/homoserine lactone efflux protein [Vibrio spartinae]SIO93816.1 Homoserine/homoserine lactone efflux protein [Vibrio spartinae]